MENTKKLAMNIRPIAYWLITGILTFILSFSGIGALTRQEFLIEAMKHIGFPLYVMNILGIAYVLAAIAIIVPRLPQLKEWAYAGVVFAMVGAFTSHVSIGDTLAISAPTLVILSLTVASYILRPNSRRLVIRAKDNSLGGK